MTPAHGQSSNLFVANLNQVSLEKIVRSKLEVLLNQAGSTKVKNLFDQILEQVEKPMIEVALDLQKGNQIKTASFLGINRNTLRKKMLAYKIKPVGNS